MTTMRLSQSVRPSTFMRLPCPGGPSVAPRQRKQAALTEIRPGTGCTGSGSSGTAVYHTEKGFPGSPSFLGNFPPGDTRLRPFVPLPDTSSVPHAPVRTTTRGYRGKETAS